jgi:hypothetical protein
MSKTKQLACVQNSVEHEGNKIFSKTTCRTDWAVHSICLLNHKADKVTFNSEKSQIQVSTYERQNRYEVFISKVLH